MAYQITSTLKKKKPSASKRYFLQSKKDKKRLLHFNSFFDWENPTENKVPPYIFQYGQFKGCIHLGEVKARKMVSAWNKDSSEKIKMVRALTYLKQNSKQL